MKATEWNTLRVTVGHSIHNNNNGKRELFFSPRLFELLNRSWYVDYFLFPYQLCIHIETWRSLLSSHRKVCLFSRIRFPCFHPLISRATRGHSSHLINLTFYVTPLITLSYIYFWCPVWHFLWICDVILYTWDRMSMNPRYPLQFISKIFNEKLGHTTSYPSVFFCCSNPLTELPLGHNGYNKPLIDTSLLILYKILDVSRKVIFNVKNIWILLLGWKDIIFGWFILMCLY